MLVPKIVQKTPVERNRLTSFCSAPKRCHNATTTRLSHSHQSTMTDMKIPDDNGNVKETLNNQHGTTVRDILDMMKADIHMMQEMERDFQDMNRQLQEIKRDQEMDRDLQNSVKRDFKEIKRDLYTLRENSE